MNAPFQFLYGNAVSPEYLRSLNTPTSLSSTLRNSMSKPRRLFANSRHTLTLIPPSPSSDAPPRAATPVTAE